MLVGAVGVEGVELDDAVSEEGYGWEGRLVCELGEVCVREVRGLEAVFDEGEGLGEGELADAEEGLEADDVVVRAVVGGGPEADEGFKEGAACLLVGS